MPTVYTEVEVDVSLSDFETEDLLDELDQLIYQVLGRVI